MSVYTEIIVQLMAFVALGFSVYCAIRIRQLEKRINNSEANFAFIKDMLVEIDSKLIKLDIENHIREKLAEINSPDDIDEKEITNYVKDLIDKHKKISK